MRIFISAVSPEFESARDRVANGLQAKGHQVKVQRSFRLGHKPSTTLRKVHDYIRDCDAVICVVGKYSGSYPPQESEFLPSDMLPEGIDRASYTQWEFHFARRYGKHPYVYLAAEGWKPDRPPFDDDDAAHQQAFVDFIKQRNLDRDYFNTAAELGELVFKEDWPNLAGPKPIKLPYPSIGTLFKGREEFLQQLRASLRRAGDGRATAVTGKALHGLGGVGKTRLAVEYAWQHVDEFTAVLFITADSPENLRRNLAELTGPLVLDLEEHAATEEDVRVAAALRWLQQHPGWFLILDNVDDEETAGHVEELLATLHCGEVLITSRLNHWSQCVERLELNVLDHRDAAQFLLQRTEFLRATSPDDQSVAEGLAKELGGLALALEQAGAYVERRRISLAEYLQRWRRHEAEVRDWHDPRIMKYPQSVAVTWQTTFEELSFEARCLLNVLCFFSPDPIPRRVFAGDASAAWLCSVIESQRKGMRAVIAKVWGALSQISFKLFSPKLRISENDIDSFDFAKFGQIDIESILEELLSFSLLGTSAGPDEAYVIHRVVQAVINQNLGKQARKDFGEAAFLLIGMVASRSSVEDPAESQFWELISPHVRTVLSDESWFERDRSIGLGLMGLLGASCFQKALYREAEYWLRKVQDHATNEFKSSDVYIGCLVNLGSVAGHNAHFEEAESLYHQTLELLRRQPTPDPKLVATVEGNLGRLAFQRGDLKLARKLTQSNLTIVCNDESSAKQYAVALNNLGLIEHEEEDHESAESCFRQALDVEVSLFGGRHPAIARTLQNLARVLRDTGQTLEAEERFRQAIEIYREFLGTDHPELAITLSNLGQLAQADDRFDEAEECFRDALRIQRIVHGTEHPSVAVDLVNLGNLYVCQRRFEEAVDCIQEAIAIDERVFGPDHWELGTDLFNLGIAKMGLKRLAEAKEILERCRQIKVASRGQQHSSVREVNQLLMKISVLQSSRMKSEAQPDARDRLWKFGLANDETNVRGSFTEVGPAGREFQSGRVQPVRVGRNQKCPCGSGKKYKHCCGRRR